MDVHMLLQAGRQCVDWAWLKRKQWTERNDHTRISQGQDEPLDLTHTREECEQTAVTPTRWNHCRRERERVTTLIMTKSLLFERADAIESDRTRRFVQVVDFHFWIGQREKTVCVFMDFVILGFEGPLVALVQLILVTCCGLCSLFRSIEIGEQTKRREFRSSRWSLPSEQPHCETMLDVSRCESLTTCLFQTKTKFTIKKGKMSKFMSVPIVPNEHDGKRWCEKCTGELSEWNRN